MMMMMMSVIIDWATLHTWMAKFSRQMCQPSLARPFRTVQSCWVTFNFKSSSVARTLRYSCMRCSTSLSHSLGSVGCCRSPLDIERRVNSARSAFTMITYAIYIGLLSGVIHCWVDVIESCSPSYSFSTVDRAVPARWYLSNLALWPSRCDMTAIREHRNCTTEIATNPLNWQW